MERIQGFEPKIDFKELTTLGMIFTLLIAGKGGLVAAFAVIFFMTLTRREWLVKGVIYAFLIRFSNPALFNVDEKISTGLSWLLVGFVFMISLIQFVRKHHKLDRFILHLLLFSFILLIGSLIKSPYWVISLLKLIAFLFGFLAVYFSILLNRGYNWENFVYNILLFYVTVSMPLLVIRQIGFAKNNLSFQGITNHPQFYGVFLATLLSFFIYYLYSLKTKSFFVYLSVKGVIVVGLFQMLMTDARTGIFALAISIALAKIIYLFKQTKSNVPFYEKKFIPREILLLILGGMLISALYYKQINAKLNNIIFKKVRVSNLNSSGFSGLTSSRAELIENSVDNFLREPMLGSGFGVPSNKEFAEIKKIGNIPVSAAVEKGNLVSALLEETGLVGSFFFLLFISGVFFPVVKHTDIKYGTLFLTMFLTNMGEMFFFSTNGAGIFVWFILMLVYSRVKKK